MQAPANPLTALQKGQFISVTTYRKSGEAVSTPVWFAEENGKLYVLTGATSGKIKRIRNNPMVTVAPCGPGGRVQGPVINATARIIADNTEEARHVEHLLSKKYGLQKSLFEVFSKLSRAIQRKPSAGDAAVYLELTPC